MSNITEQLSDIERMELGYLEDIVEEGISKLQAAREALITIRDRRLYREYRDDQDKPLTFDVYCEQRFNIRKDYANKLIAFEKVRQNIKNEYNCIQPPQHEGQARSLSSLKPEEQTQVWQAAQQTTGKDQPTAKEVNKEVQEWKKKHQEEERLRKKWEADYARLEKSSQIYYCEDKVRFARWNRGIDAPDWFATATNQAASHV